MRSSPIKLALPSLRSKIFLLIMAILAAVALVIMLISQRDLTRTVVASERHGINNVMELLLRDIQARWEALLNAKITTVRGSRQQLLQTGASVRETLEAYAELSQRGIVTESAAKAMALAWINDLTLDPPRYAFVYDRRHTVLASGDPAMINRSLTNVVDFKGQPLAAGLYEESRKAGYGLAIYRWPLPNNPSNTETRYAYFGYFKPWDWVFVFTDVAQDVNERVQAHLVKMEFTLNEALSKLTLARTGFVFIAAKDGRMIVPLPPNYTYLLEAKDSATGSSLIELLADVEQTGKLESFSFGGPNQAWQMEAAHFRPLGWTIVAAVPKSDLTAPATHLRNRLALIFGGMLLIALAFAWLVARHIGQPLQLLTRYARFFPSQDLTAPQNVPAYIARLPVATHGDEVGELAESFLTMDRQLRENIAQRLRETSVRERVESELNIARAIQMGLLPVPLAKPVTDKVDLHAVTVPAKEVGGDLYDYFILSDGRLCLAIGEVSETGVPAALFMAISRTLIRATAEYETDPSLILQRVNQRLALNNPHMTSVTLLLMVLDLETGELKWANANHAPAAVAGSSGQIRFLEGHSGPVCGLHTATSYLGFQSRLGPGETLVCYTTGIVEATSPDGAQYGQARLVDLISRPAVDAPALAKQLQDDVQSFAAGAEQSSDLTLLIVRRL